MICECGVTVHQGGYASHRNGQNHAVRIERARLEAAGLVGIDGLFRSQINDYVEGPLAYVAGALKNGKVIKAQVIRGIYVRAALAEITTWEIPDPMRARIFECCGHLSDEACDATVSAGRAMYALDSEHAEIVAFFEAAMRAAYGRGDEETTP